MPAAVFRAALVGLGLAGCAAGCSNRVAVYPVRGQVLYLGQPCADAFVILHPQPGNAQLALFRPRGQCDASGNFQISTYGKNDGAPAGEYKVTVVWPGPPSGYPPDDIPAEERASGPDRFQGRYDSAEKSQLTATVARGANTLPAFDLK